jgi:hypothetical protein
VIPGFQLEALMARFDLTDAEWTVIAPLLPGAEGRKNGRPRPDDRKVLNGIFFVLRTGTPWRRPAGALWALHDRVQSVQPQGEGGHLASNLRAAGVEITAVAATG